MKYYYKYTPANPFLAGILELIVTEASTARLSNKYRIISVIQNTGWESLYGEGDSISIVPGGIFVLVDDPNDLLKEIL